MDKPSLDQLMQLIEGVKNKNSQLDKVAAQGVVNQPWKRPGQTGGDLVMGRGSPDQKRAMMGMASSVLNRAPGQNAMGAAAQGFEKGSQIMDEIRLKEKAERLNGAKTAVDSAKDAYGMGKDMYDRQWKEKRAEVEDEQWLKDYEQAAEGRTYASQVKFHETLIRDYRESMLDAAEAESLAAELADVASSFDNGGIGVTVDEWIKSQTGARDRVSVLRTRFTKLKNRKMVQGLPPGVASDRDVKLIDAGFPKTDATLKEMQEWAEGIARVERGLAEYNRFAEKYVGDNNYSAVGLIDAWEDYVKIRDENKKKASEYTSSNGVTFTIEGE